MRTIEPYRILFPIGALNAVLGVIPWILFSYGKIATFPNILHSRMMVLGFLGSYVCGFLMTAVPRMTGTESAKPVEVYSVALLGIVHALYAGGISPAIPLLVWLMQFIFLFLFVFRRFRKISQTGKSPALGGLIFIPIGLISAAVGAGIQLLAFFDPSAVSDNGIRYGQILLQQGFLLNLIVGLGSRLIPMISKKPGALSPLQGDGNFSKLLKWEALLLNLSFVFESFYSKETGILTRAAVLCVVLFMNYKIHRRANEGTFLGRGLSFASSCLVFSYFGVFLFPLYEIHIMHVLYIGGFGLLTLLISMRVLVAHGGESTESEKKSWHILAVVILGTIVVLGRLLLPVFSPESYLSSMATMALLWILVICWYGTSYLKKVMNRSVDKC